MAKMSLFWTLERLRPCSTLFQFLVGVLGRNTPQMRFHKSGFHICKVLFVCRVDLLPVFCQLRISESQKKRICTFPETVSVDRLHKACTSLMGTARVLTTMIQTWTDLAQCFSNCFFQPKLERKVTYHNFNHFVSS